MLESILLNIIGSFVTSITFAIIMQSPKDCWLVSGFVGCFGWMGYWGLNSYYDSVFVASIVCSLILSLSSQVASRKLKKPTIIFFVPGLAPVVPGVTFFHGFQALITRQYVEAGYVFLNVLYSAVGLACGIGIADIFMSLINYKNKKA